ncbi:MAG: hypothetical protein J6L92_01060 [Clostridia bacterium]|nr:hypothetical protein [Clostridia bacterium]
MNKKVFQRILLAIVCVIAVAGVSVLGYHMVTQAGEQDVSAKLDSIVELYKEGKLSLADLNIQFHRVKYGDFAPAKYVDHNSGENDPIVKYAKVQSAAELYNNGKLLVENVKVINEQNRLLTVVHISYESQKNVAGVKAFIENCKNKGYEVRTTGEYTTYMCIELYSTEDQKADIKNSALGNVKISHFSYVTENGNLYSYSKEDEIWYIKSYVLQYLNDNMMEGIPESIYLDGYYVSVDQETFDDLMAQKSEGKQGPEDGVWFLYQGQYPVKLSKAAAENVAEQIKIQRDN